MKHQFPALLMVLSSLLLSAQASASVVDFENYSPSAVEYYPSELSNQGLNFKGSNIWVTGANVRCAGITNHSNRIEFNQHYTYTIKSETTQRFSLTQLDLGLGCTFGNGEEDVFFSATRADGSIVNRSVTASMLEFRTFAFTGFDDITSLVISKTWTDDNPSMFFDNIVFDALPDQAVPEPASLALFLLGLVGLTGLRRKVAQR